MEIIEELKSFKSYVEGQLSRLYYESLDEQFFESLELATTDKAKKKIEESYQYYKKLETSLNDIFESLIDEDEFDDTMNEDFDSEDNLNRHYIKHCETSLTLAEIQTALSKPNTSPWDLAWRTAERRKKGHRLSYPSYTFTDIEDYKKLENKCWQKVKSIVSNFGLQKAPEYIFNDLSSFTAVYGDRIPQIEDLFKLVDKHSIVVFMPGCNIIPYYKRQAGDDEPRIYIIHDNMHSSSDVDRPSYDLQVLYPRTLDTMALYPIAKNDTTSVNNIIQDGKEV